MCYEDHIQQGPGETRVGFLTELQLDVAKLMLPYRARSAIKHGLLYIHCQDLAGRSHRPREPPCKIARARSYLSNRRARGNLQRADQRIGTLLRIPPDAVQKLNARIGMMRLTGARANLRSGPTQSAKITHHIADFGGGQSASVRRHQRALFAAQALKAVFQKRLRISVTVAK